MKRKTTVIDPHGQPFNVSYSHRREGLILVDHKYKPDPKTTIRLFNVTHEASGYQINGCVSTLKKAKAMQSELLGFAKSLGISWQLEEDFLRDFFEQKGLIPKTAFSIYLSGGAA